MLPDFKMGKQRVSSSQKCMNNFFNQSLQAKLRTVVSACKLPSFNNDRFHFNSHGIEKTLKIPYLDYFHQLIHTTVTWEDWLS